MFLLAFEKNIRNSENDSNILAEGPQKACGSSVFFYKATVVHALVELTGENNENIPHQ